MKFTPPPLIKKPPHPFTHLTKPAWTKKIYFLGILVWVIFFQLMALVIFLISHSFFWKIELGAMVFGLLIGHMMSLSILQKLLSRSDHL
ncbi:hypothetical protein EXS71_01285 [Candidatus Uhrbacteria bacterium]|nr:hypothetical protein [Candidatus Uhrbacteria bacterium]